MTAVHKPDNVLAPHSALSRILSIFLKALKFPLVAALVIDVVLRLRSGIHHSSPFSSSTIQVLMVLVSIFGKVGMRCFWQKS